MYNTYTLILHHYIVYTNLCHYVISNSGHWLVVVVVVVRLRVGCSGEIGGKLKALRLQMALSSGVVALGKFGHLQYIASTAQWPQRPLWLASFCMSHPPVTI